MAGEWPIVRLGELIEVKHGWPFKSESFSEELTARPIVVNIGNFRYTGGFRFENTTVREYRGDYPREYELAPGEILLVMTCQTAGGEILGIPARVPDDGRTYLHNQRLGRVVVRDASRVNEDFLYWLFLSQSFNRELYLSASGTKILHTAPTRIEAVRVELPTLGEQRAIAHILGTLDDKIELNRRMNETLEQVARALFKSWFVDFDPVRAKSEGRDPGLSSEIADLFPDSFEESELGEIPKGWRAGRLDDILTELVSGARPRGGAVEEGVPSVGAENVIGLGRYDFSKEKYVPREFFKELKRKGSAVHAGDILLYKDGASIGRKTYFDCGFPHAECAINEHVFILRANRPTEQRFLFFWLDQLWMTHEIISLNSNSAQPGINQPGVRGLPALIADDEVIDTFDRLTAQLTTRLFTNCRESSALAALRDALLPQLISGELRTTRSEVLMAEATSVRVDEGLLDRTSASVVKMET
jgi:type I restriction enzyme S subunit